MPEVATDRFPTDVESVAAFRAARKIFLEVLLPWSEAGCEFEAVEHEFAMCARRWAVASHGALSAPVTRDGILLTEDRVDLAITAAADLLLVHSRNDSITAIRLGVQDGEAELCRRVETWLAERADCLTFDDDDGPESL
jgi:hypothetical protein